MAMVAVEIGRSRAVDLHGVPEKITIDKSGSSTAAIVSIQADARLQELCMIRKGQLGAIEDQAPSAFIGPIRPPQGLPTPV